MVVSKRLAFTMIELIFAIVIIAITVVSLPMMTQVTASGASDNLEAQEAIFKAIVLTKTMAGENTFTSIDGVATSVKTDISEFEGLLNYKFNQTYTLEVTPNATFNGETNANIKKITTKIYSQSNELITSFSAYKFNY